MAEKKNAGAAPGAASEKKEKPEIPTKTFKADGKIYRFTRAQFIVPGHGKLTAQEVLDMAAEGNKEPLAVLVQNEASVIEVVGTYDLKPAKTDKPVKDEKPAKADKPTKTHKTVKVETTSSEEEKGGQ